MCIEMIGCLRLCVSLHARYCLGALATVLRFRAVQSSAMEVFCMLAYLYTCLESMLAYIFSLLIQMGSHCAAGLQAMVRFACRISICTRLLPFGFEQVIQYIVQVI